VTQAERVHAQKPQLDHLSKKAERVDMDVVGTESIALNGEAFQSAEFAEACVFAWR
jgi:hypothetical protein